MKDDLTRILASKIWHRLETNLTDTNLISLKKDFNLSEPELVAALDCLEKKDKIVFVNYEDKTTYVFPKHIQL
jgi:hypothetical protein